MSKLFGSYLDGKRRATWKYVESWQGTVYSIVVFVATMVVMFWASVFLYTSFYFTYMPTEALTWPVHFNFNSCGDKPGICSNPQSIISVTDPIQGALLARGQKYRVVLDIEMPESPANQRLGMFQITMGMKSHDGDLLRQASRSSMLRYKSPLLHTISTFAFAPFLLYGVNEEKQMVTVELFSQYEEDPVIPLSEVHIEIFSRHVEMYSAQLRIHAMFSGLRYFMYHYPLSAAGVGVGICMAFLSTIVIFSWYQFSEPTDKIEVNPRQQLFPNGRLASGGSSGIVKTDKIDSRSSSLSGGQTSSSKAGVEDMSSSMETSSSSNPNMAMKAEDDDNLKGKDVEAEAAEKPESDEVTSDSTSPPRRDSDEFEVVSSMKNQSTDDTNQPSGLHRNDDEETMVRHRVQSIASSY